MSVRGALQEVQIVKLYETVEEEEARQVEEYLFLHRLHPILQYSHEALFQVSPRVILYIPADELDKAEFFLHRFLTRKHFTT